MGSLLLKSLSHQCYSHVIQVIVNNMKKMFAINFAVFPRLCSKKLTRTSCSKLNHLINFNNLLQRRRCWWEYFLGIFLKLLIIFQLQRSKLLISKSDETFQAQIYLNKFNIEIILLLHRL